MKTIGLVDWNWTGHHSTYFKNLTAGFIEAGCRVAAFCPSGAVNEVLKYATNDRNTTVDICRYVHPRQRIPRLLRSRDHAWRLFGTLEKNFQNWETINKSKIDLVFFSTIYDFEFENICHSKSRFSRPWSGIYLHARAFRMPGTLIPYANRLPCPEKIFTHPSLSSVCLIDEGAIHPMQKLTKGKPVFEFPDITGTDIELPLEGDTLAGKLKRFSNGRKIVVCLGHLQKTKGLIELCHLARDPRASNICIFFGGEVNWSELSPDEVRFIQATWEHCPNVLTHLARLDDSTINALIKVSDVVFAAYTNFPNSSNIMTKAALLNRPLIVSDGHLMAERVRKYKLGFTVPEGSIEDILQNTLQLCMDGGDVNAGYNTYYEKHSTEALQSILTKVISAI